MTILPGNSRDYGPKKRRNMDRPAAFAASSPQVRQTANAWRSVILHVGGEWQREGMSTTNRVGAQPQDTTPGYKEGESFNHR